MFEHLGGCTRAVGARGCIAEFTQRSTADSDGVYGNGTGSLLSSYHCDGVWMAPSACKYDIQGPSEY